jgi:non-ribosomal peptide synthetase component F
VCSTRATVFCAMAANSLFFQVLIFLPAACAFISRISSTSHAGQLSKANGPHRSHIIHSDSLPVRASRGQVCMAIPAQDVQIRIADLDWKVVPDIWESLANVIPDKSMLVDPVHGDKVDLTFSQCNNLITTGAAAMQKLGVLPDECVSIFAENSYKWFIADQAIMKSGCCNSVRGALAPIDELHYIYENSKSVALVVESPNLLRKFFAPSDSVDGSAKSSSIGTPRFVIVLFSQGMNGAELAADAGIPSDVKVLSYEEWLASSKKVEFKPVPRDPT